MPHVERQGVELYYECYGEGAPIVLVHPMATNHYLWTHQIFALARQHRVIAVDLRGHGRSSKPARGYAIAEMAADVLAVLDAEGVASAVLVGNSIGGMVALQTTLDAPARVRATVVVSSGTNLAAGAPPGAAQALLDDFEGVILAMLGGAISPATRRDRPEVFDTIAALYNLRDNVTREVFLACGSDPGGVFRWDIRGRLAEIVGPTLVLAGADDRTMPAEVTRRLAEAIPGARFELVPEVGHFLPIEQPARFNAILREFLAGLPA